MQCSSPGPPQGISEGRRHIFPAANICRTPYHRHRTERRRGAAKKRHPPGQALQAATPSVLPAPLALCRPSLAGSCGGHPALAGKGTRGAGGPLGVKCPQEPSPKLHVRSQREAQLEHVWASHVVRGLLAQRVGGGSGPCAQQRGRGTGPLSARQGPPLRGKHFHFHGEEGVPEGRPRGPPSTPGCSRIKRLPPPRATEATPPAGPDILETN